MRVAPAEHDIEEHFGLIHYVIHKYFQSSLSYVEYDELFQEGCLALLNAIRRFDPNVGAGFSTFATKAILNSVRLALWRYNNLPLKVGRNTLLIAQNIRQENAEQSTEEIMKRFKCGKKMAEMARQLINMQFVSMEQTIHQDSKEDSGTVQDFIPIFDDLSTPEVEEFMSLLNDRERKVTLFRVYGMSQKEIGEMIGVSKTRIQQHLEDIRKKYERYDRKRR